MPPAVHGSNHGHTISHSPRADILRMIGPEAPPEPFSPTKRQAEIHLYARQQGTVAIPTLYANQNDSPNPGAVVGITLGSVAAFVVLVWLFSTIITGRQQQAIAVEEVVSVRRRSSRSPPRSSRRSRRSEMSRRPGERRIIQERIIRDSSRPARTTYVEEEVIRPGGAGGNMVEVVEEGESSVYTAPPRRRDRSR